MKMKWQLIAVHGWGSDQRCWQSWLEPCEKRGWPLECFERGYGEFKENSPEWKSSYRHALIVNSLGLHLTPSKILANSDAVILLASFGKFVPAGSDGRNMQIALKAMAQKLEKGKIRELFEEFREKVAAPQLVDYLPAGVEEQEISERGKKKLLDDLDLLAKCKGIPECFPQGAAVLIVEAGNDQIVSEASKAELHLELKNAEIIKLDGIGHGLLVPALAETMLTWLAKQ
jgi:pimeloyl-[acyl-carrier protein] methyl ester esterase